MRPRRGSHGQRPCRLACRQKHQRADDRDAGQQREAQQVVAGGVAQAACHQRPADLTDGETAPLDLSYGTYGIEPLDQRRWSKKSTETLTQVVEGRFGVACSEVRKRNITVWVIGFGTSLNPIMTECAGPGHFFEAQDAAELQDVFSKIAAQLGDLRVSK